MTKFNNSSKRRKKNTEKKKSNTQGRIIMNKSFEKINMYEEKVQILQKKVGKENEKP